MACHIRNYSTSRKSEETRRMPLTRLSPIPLKNVEFRDGMGLRLVNGIHLVSSLFLKG